MGGQGGIERKLTGPGGGGGGEESLGRPIELICIQVGSPWGVWTDRSPWLTRGPRC